MKAGKPRMGRPPLAPGKAREIVFTLRLTEDEREEIVRAARLVDRQPAQWARDVLLTEARR